MSTETASLFFALLALAATFGSVVTVSVLIAARRSGPDGSVAPWRDDLRRAALPLAWAVALVTTLGSLYYSEIAHFTPCKLCWFQRIAVYPLAVLLGIATFRRDAGVRIYVIVQCALGAVVAAYHSYLQAYPPEGGSSFCTADAPCTARFVWEFGFVSLPLMALVAFVSIITLLVAAGSGSDLATPGATND